WHARDVQLPDARPPVVAQLAIERAVKEWRSTPELLQHVYLMKPMLRAAPGEVLDFREIVPPPTAPATAPPLTAKQQKKRKEAIAAARERIRQLRENRISDAKLVDVHPTYDEEFDRVTEVLEADNGAQDDPFEAEATFDESVWKSGVRGGEVP
ncbi:MAG TPA: hypothetical protein VJR89_31380, partial [Polyangiales bacterium]|nr:hypothetical protein [Polyangiales bacterium]